MSITAQKVDIIEARQTSSSSTEQKFKQSGFTLEVTSPVLSALQTVSQMAQAAGNTSDTRMKALAGANAGFAANNAANAIQAGQGSLINGKEGQIATQVDDKGQVLASRDATAAEKTGGINVSLSFGSSSSQSLQRSQSDSARSSSVTAGGKVVIAATGAGQASDLTVRASTVQAGQSAVLLADNHIQLLAAQNTASQAGTSLGPHTFSLHLLTSSPSASPP